MHRHQAKEAPLLIGTMSFSIICRRVIYRRLPSMAMLPSDDFLTTLTTIHQKRSFLRMQIL